MKKAIIAVVLVSSLALANSNSFPKIGIPSAYSSLAKKSSSNLALTSYSSAWFNIQYTCPTGWTITDTTNTGNMFMELTVSNPNLIATITISAAKMNTITEASELGSWYCFGFAYNTYRVNASLYMPAINEIVDTIVTGVNFKNLQVMASYASGAYTVVGSVCTEAKDSSCIEFEYYTSVSDNLINSPSYLQNWNNVSFYSPTSLSKQQSINALAIIKPTLLKENSVDILGRTAPNFNASQMIVEPHGLLKQVIKK